MYMYTLHPFQWSSIIPPLGLSVVAQQGLGHLELLLSPLQVHQGLIVQRLVVVVVALILCIVLVAIVIIRIVVITHAIALVIILTILHMGRARQVIVLSDKAHLRDLPPFV